jgi:hypothetical protein
VAVKNVFATHTKNIRKALRLRMSLLAKTHRRCGRARGCGCGVDRALTVLEVAESELWKLELESYSQPWDESTTSRDNAIDHERPPAPTPGGE